MSARADSSSERVETGLGQRTAVHTTRIDHVGVAVNDIATASRAWIGALGFEIAEVADVLDGAIRLAYLDLGNTTLQLVQPLRPGPLADWLEQHGEGLHHICLQVDELTSTLNDIHDQGERHIYRGGRGADVCFIEAKPCGVLVELTEPSTSVVPGPDMSASPPPVATGDP